MRRIKIIGLAALALLTLVLVLQNTAPVETRLLFTTVTLPAALLLFVTAAVGFLLGLGVSFFFLRPPRPPKRGSPEASSKTGNAQPYAEPK